MRTSQTLLSLIGAVILGLLNSAALAVIEEGDCFDCHTSNHSDNGTVGELESSDCISCHAQGGDEKIVTTPGGVQMPQVYHRDPSGDLAGGNFVYVADGIGTGPTGSRKGHDVFDLFPTPFSFPPGFIHGESENSFKRITCAGMNGCHGIRNQMMLDSNGLRVPRVGLDALHGSHHANEDGPLDTADTLANSFRFLMGVRGLEHTYAPDLWQNVTPEIHNEYYGSTFEGAGYDQCSTCHVGTEHATLDSYITAPRNSMSGFCATCHSEFHMNFGGPSAFLRHPSDYVIPNKGEYARYTIYEITAPVARPTVYREPSPVVNPGRDMIMCLSCHVAHGSPYDGMLRFDYRQMHAGDAGSAAGTGCFACHTSKG